MSIIPAYVEPEDAEEDRTKHRRMWCLQQSMHVALAYFARAPQMPTIDIMQTAEEMNEFIETGVARTARVSRGKQ